MNGSDPDATRSDEPLRVAVLLGGTTGERNVSIASGAQVARALRSLGHRVACVDTASGPLDDLAENELFRIVAGEAPPTGHELPSADRSAALIAGCAEIRQADVVFNALHGGVGEDGTVQALLAAHGIAATGSTQLGATLTMNKDVAKQILRQSGIATPDWILATDPAAELTNVPELPVVVKPSSGGSTLGLSVVRRPEDLTGAIRKALQYGSTAIIERFVDGAEFTIGVLNGSALGIGEIKLAGTDVFDYRGKYHPGAAIEQFPARISEELGSILRRNAELAHRALRLGSYSRADFRLDPSGNVWCLEVNVLPGLTGTSLMPQSAAAVGISFTDLCSHIVQAAVRPRREGPAQDAADNTWSIGVNAR